MNTQECIDRVCKHRGLVLPVKVGTPCEVNGKKGFIVGGNTADNFNVLYEDANGVRNCHPGYRMRIFNLMGGIMYESDDLYTAPCPECGSVQPIDCGTEHVCDD